MPPIGDRSEVGTIDVDTETGQLSYWAYTTDHAVVVVIVKQPGECGLSQRRLSPGAIPLLPP